MKAIVYYYSASGSTAKVAKAIHKGLSTTVEVCDLASVRKADPAAAAGYDLIVIGGPVWYYRETANLRDFVYNMPDMSGKLCVLFCTHGSAPEGFHFSLATMLKKRGMTVIGWNDWYGSCYHVLHMGKPYMTDGHPDDIDLADAEKFGSEMGIRAKRVAAGERDIIPKPGTGADRDPLWSRIKFEDMQVHEPGDRPEPKFKPAKTVRTFNMNKCTHPTCTKCIEICPINSISFTDGRMTIKDSCINCALCDKMCPELAIEIDAESRAQRTNHVIDMKKCNYPECTLCADYCPMQSIAFSSGTPVFSKNCEGCDLCWTICPKAAISITNLETTHKPMTMELPLSEHPGHPFLKILEAAEKKGKFRRLVPLEQVGTNGIVWQNPNAPRFTIEHEEP